MVALSAGGLDQLDVVLSMTSINPAADCEHYQTAELDLEQPAAAADPDAPPSPSMFCGGPPTAGVVETRRRHSASVSWIRRQSASSEVQNDVTAEEDPPSASPIWQPHLSVFFPETNSKVSIQSTIRSFFIN